MQQATQQGCSMKVMMYAMPLLSGYFAYIVAAAIGIYWIFRNLLALLQQIILSKAMPLPVFTEEDYKAAEREMYKTQVRKKEKGERDPNRPKVRSLHHIDDDDDEEYVSTSAPSKYDEEEEADEKAEGEKVVREVVDEGTRGTKLNGVEIEAPIKDDKDTKFEKK